MNETIIRSAAPEDARGAALAYAASIVECYGPVDPLPCFRDIIDPEKQESAWREKIAAAGCFTFVAAQNGNILGVAHNTPPFEPATDPALKNPFDVGQVYVHNCARGYGIGRRLVGISLQEGYKRGHRAATVHGTASHAQASRRSLRFFEDICGATRSRARPFFAYTWNGSPLLAVQSEWRDLTPAGKEIDSTLRLPGFKIPDADRIQNEMRSILLSAAASQPANTALAAALKTNPQELFNAFLRRDEKLFSLRLDMQDPEGKTTYEDMDILQNMPAAPFRWRVTDLSMV